MKIAIKIGSSLLTNSANGLKSEAILKICQQIAELLRSGHQVFLVTSGAVASDTKKQRPKNLRAAVGMGRLISRYIQYFDIFGVEAGQMLLTDHDLHRQCRDSLISLFNSALENRVVPIVNANDTVDWQELEQLDICADNDILFMNLCLALKPDLAIIGFDEWGVLNSDNKVVSVVSEGNFLELLEAAQGGSDVGHGEFGMNTKMQVARILAQSGIKTIIAPGRAERFILGAVNELMNPSYKFGTQFQFNQLEFNFDETDRFAVKTVAELRLEQGVFW